MSQASHSIIECAAQSVALTANISALAYDFRSHPDVANALKTYTSIVLTRVSIVAWQTETSAPASTAAYLPFIYRVGVTPRGVVTDSISTMPHLQTFVSKPAEIAVAQFSWGEGGLPFPPGIQLDLRSAEIVSNWPNFLLAQNNLKADSTKTILQCQLNFTVSASGVGFGAATS